MSVLVFKSFTDPSQNFTRSFNYDASVRFSVNSLFKLALLMCIISIYDDKNYQYSCWNIAASVYFAAFRTTN